MPTEKDRAAERRAYARLKADPVRWERYTARRKEYRHRNPPGRREYYVRAIVSILLSAARRRAEKRGLDFSLTAGDIAIPARCPVLDIPISIGQGARGGTANSPSLDRIDNSLGYIPGNVAVISFRANTLKRDGTADELRRVADWVAENEF